VDLDEGDLEPEKNSEVQLHQTVTFVAMSFSTRRHKSGWNCGLDGESSLEE
jgi:hypothetical protein